MADEYPWDPGAGQRLVDELRPILAKNQGRDETLVPRSLLRRMQQCGLYLAQQETHKADTESLRRQVRDLDWTCAALRVDLARKVGDAENRAAAALRLLHEHGVRTDEVAAQVAWDREQARLLGQPDPQSGEQLTFTAGEEEQP